MTMTIQAALKEAWTAACEFDGIPVEAKFAVFSDANPHKKRVDLLIRMINAARRVQA